MVYYWQLLKMHRGPVTVSYLLMCCDSVIYTHITTIECIILYILPHCRVEIEAEIRRHVDELMREELKNLKLVSSSEQNIISI